MTTTALINPTALVTTAAYAHSYPDVLANFDALLHDMTFVEELQMLEIGRTRFILRYQLKQHWIALTIALWRLALERSFPADWQRIFEAFVQHHLKCFGNEKKRSAFLTILRCYLDLSEINKENNFTPLSSYLINTLPKQPKELTNMRLRVSLHLRTLYNLIFEKLI